MKTKILFIISASIILLANSCKNNQTMEQCLTIQNERERLMLAIANNNALANEMVQIMMSDDSCKNLLRDNIIQDTTMINRLLVMIAKDTNMSKMMVVKSIEMCDGDPLKCNLLRSTMQMYPSTLLYINKEPYSNITAKKLN